MTNYNIIKKIEVGSYHWFKDIDGFVPGDRDYVYIYDWDEKTIPDVEGECYVFNFGEFEGDDFNTEFIMYYPKEGYTNGSRMICKTTNCDCLMYPNKGKELVIADFVETNSQSFATTFLFPEFVDYFGITFQDILPHFDKFDNMKEKYNYLKVIGDSYLKNGGLTLTEEQRAAAYESYLITRGKNKTG